LRIVRKDKLAGPKGHKPPARPDWFQEWLANQGKWVLLECGCIEDVHLPQCVELLTGKKIYIACPFDLDHGFQLIKMTLKFRDVLSARGITFPNDTDPKGLFPPF
jgi:hypothetical protein